MCRSCRKVLQVRRFTDAKHLSRLLNASTGRHAKEHAQLTTVEGECLSREWRHHKVLHEDRRHGDKGVAQIATFAAIERKVAQIATFAAIERKDGGNETWALSCRESEGTLI